MKYRPYVFAVIAFASLSSACNQSQSKLKDVPDSDNNGGADSVMPHGDSDITHGDDTNPPGDNAVPSGDTAAPDGDAVTPAGDTYQPADNDVAGDPSVGGDEYLAPGDMSGCGLTIQHTPPAYLTLEAPILVAQISEGTAATFYYRLANPGTSFTNVAMTKNGQQFTADLTQRKLSYAGIYYYIEVVAGDCTATSPVVNPTTAPHFVDIVGGMRLTHDADLHYYKPSVYNDTVVYSVSDGDEQKDKSYAFNLNTLEVTQLTNGMTTRSAAGIVEDRVVFVDIEYSDDGYGSQDIYVANSIGGAQLNITPGDDDQYHASFAGHIVVWRDDRNGTDYTINGDIYGFDLGPDGSFGTADDRGEFVVSTDSHEESAPKVWVDRLSGRARIVWYRNSETASFDGDIYMYDSGPDAQFGTADDVGPTQITTDPDDQESPAIFDNRIVWRDDRNGAWDIYVYDLGLDGLFGTADDGGEAPLDVTTVEAANLALWGERLVWDDYLNGSYEVHLYDFVTEIETFITQAPLAQVYPRIHEKTIVWEDARDNDTNDDIYVFRLP